MRSIRLCLLALCCLFLASPARPVRAQAPDEEAITTARQRGVKYLKSKQKRDGSWDFGGHDVGISALCTIALIENGVDLTDSSIQGGYEFVRKKARELKNTYDISLAIVMLQRMGDRRDKPLIRNLAARLIAGQLESGGWHYTCPGAELDAEKALRDSSLKLKEGFGDNSCTQFAVLGLWVASRVGVDIEKTLRRVTGRFEKHQTDDGGWAYALGAKGAKPVSSPSMTGAGLFCLAVARAWELREAQKGGKAAETKAEDATPARKTLLDDEVFARGLKRTGEFSSGIGPGAGRYFLWSVERVGVLLALEKIGDVNWFAIGANALLKDQQEDGSWTSAWPDTDADRLSDTCLAILFLRRANLGSDISRLLEGDYDEKFEISSRQPVVRFAKLAEAVQAAEPGETIRITGNGPWRLGHLEIDKDLTIQAAHGFAPVFKFEIGRNKKGLRFKPETDPEGRDMIAIHAGRVTLEGLKLQMEPSRDQKQVPWSIVTIDGGSLRLLNCSLSETTQQGTIAVRWNSSGPLVIRNCQLMGGRAGVEVTGGAEQELVLDNTLIFSPNSVALLPPAEAAGSTFQLRARHCVFQAKDFLASAGFTGSIDVDVETSVFQAEWLSANFLREGSSPKEGRSWKGGLNVYDVKQWVGPAGKSTPLKDGRDWLKFWDGSEQDSFKRTAPFVGTRRLGSYSHEANIQDWQLEFPASAEAPLQRNRVGINSYVAGPGTGYDQYRETIGYTHWKKYRLELSDRHRGFPGMNPLERQVVWQAR